ncbi:MAG: hypothetical protein ACOYOU_08085 [Kiritimatiellia bacterium]
MSNRTNLVKGPGVVKFGDVVLHSADGITGDVAVETTAIPSDMEGEVDKLLVNRFGEASIRPVGQLSAPILAALYPHQTPDIGSPLFGATDVPLILHSKAGVMVTFLNAALVAPPQLILSATRTAFGGAAKFRALIAADKAPGDEDSFITFADAAYSALDYPFLATAKGGRYVGTLGTGQGSLQIDTLAGWTIDVQIGTTSWKTDNEGEIAHDLASVSVLAKCTPVRLSESDLLGLVPWNSAQGASARSGNNLVISAGAGSGVVKATLYDVAVLQGPCKWGATALRAGEIGFTAHRTVAADTLGALYQVIMEPAV